MEADERRRWTLLTSHGHVLVEIARNTQARVRDIAAAIGITERATQAIIADLERAGYVERVRMGRRTHYVLHTDNPFRHSAQDGLLVGPFLELLTGPTDIADVVTAPLPDEGLVSPAAAIAAAAAAVPVAPVVLVAPVPVAPVAPIAPVVAPLDVLATAPEPPEPAA